MRWRVFWRYANEPVDPSLASVLAPLVAGHMTSAIVSVGSIHDNAASIWPGIIFGAVMFVVLPVVLVPLFMTTTWPTRSEQIMDDLMLEELRTTHATTGGVSVIRDDERGRITMEVGNED